MHQPWSSCAASENGPWCMVNTLQQKLVGSWHFNYLNWNRCVRQRGEKLPKNGPKNVSVKEEIGTTEVRARRLEAVKQNTGANESETVKNTSWKTYGGKTEYRRTHWIRDDKGTDWKTVRCLYTPVSVCI